MTAYKPQDALAHWTVQDMLRQCLTSGRMVEVVYRDSAGQVCIAHDVIRDLFNRAGPGLYSARAGRVAEPGSRAHDRRSAALLKLRLTKG